MTSPIAVVIPALDAAETIGEQLAAVAAQVPPPFEVVVADNGSSDRTTRIVAEWPDQGFDVRLVDASQRSGSAHARNIGVESTTCERIAFCDADDLVAPGWLSALDAALDDHEVVGGRLDGSHLNDETVAAWRPHRGDDSLSVPEGFLPFAPSGNMAVHRSVWADLGGMRVDYPVGHDVEFSWRAQLGGARIGYAPDALLHHRYRTTTAGTYRQAFGFGRATAQLHSDFEHHGLKARRLRQALRDWIWLVARAPMLASKQGRGVWSRRAGQAAGRLRGSIEFRTLCL